MKLFKTLIFFIVTLLVKLNETITTTTTTTTTSTTHLAVDGHTHLRQGHYALALAYFEQRLAACNCTYSETEELLLIGIGQANIGLGAHQRALEYGERALRNSYEMHQMPNHIQTARSLTLVSQAQIGLGQFAKAHQLALQALQMSENLRNDLATVHAQFTLGLALSGLGDHLQALSYLRARALSGYIKILAGYNEDRNSSLFMAGLLSAIGEACDGCGDYRDAIEYFEKSLHIYQNVLAAADVLDTGPVLRLLLNLGQAFYNIRFCDKTKARATWKECGCVKSVKYFEDALAMRERMRLNGRREENMVQGEKILGRVAACYKRLGDETKSKEFRRRKSEVKKLSRPVVNSRREDSFIKWLYSMLVFCLVAFFACMFLFTLPKACFSRNAKYSYTHHFNTNSENLNDYVVK